MAIVEYVENNETFFRVRVVRKSATNSGVLVQKKAKSLRTFSEAQKIERKLDLEAQRELITKEQQGLTWGALLGQWEMAVRSKDIFTREIAASTFDDYLSVIGKYAYEWNDLQITDIEKALAWRLLDKIERAASGQRRKKLRAAIDSVFKWAILSGRAKGIKELPTAGYKGLSKDEEKLPEILNLTEIRSLLVRARDMQHEWYHVWAVALFTGMRSGELFALDWSKVDFDNNLIYVHMNWTSKEGYGPTKGRYWRVLPIGPELMSLLKEIRLKNPQGKFVLPHYSDWAKGKQAGILRTFCVGAGIPSIKFHTLRACFATQLIRDGVAPAIIMKVGGWKDLKTMQRYIRLAGIEVDGATDSLKFLPEPQVMGRVIDLFSK